MSSKDNLALDLEHGVRRWDRARWISVFSSHNPTIREVTECLGLGLSASSSTTNRGIPKFDNPDYRKLSSEVTKLSKELPKERDALLDFAADPQSLDQELEELLASYGPAIWGRDADRSCLLTPDPTKKTYNKNLFYEEPEHKETLKIHLHRWIIIKACYYIRNMKLKRPSGANEYDQLADIDGDGVSPRGTPQSLTPPDPDTATSADLEVKPINLKKRKSNVHLTISDDEEMDATPVKRPYSTMPISRKSSPRKSLKSLYPAGPGSMENAPPLPTHVHRFSPAPGAGPETARIQLSALSNSELNGGNRLPSITQSPVPSGFTAVNTGSFTPVNTTPPVKEPSREPVVRDGTREASKEVQRHSPTLGHRHSSSYTSPYEPSAHGAATARPATDPPRSAPLAASTPALSHGLQPATAPVAVNGANGQSKDSPAAQHAHIAPQPQQPQGLQRSPPQPTHQPQHTQHSHLPSHPHAPAQQQLPRPPSRGNTPGILTRSLAPHPRSRSSTPHALVAPLQPTTALNKQVTSAPALQSAPAYGMHIVPMSDAPSVSNHRAPSSHAPPTAPQHASHQTVLKSQYPDTAPVTHSHSHVHGHAHAHPHPHPRIAHVPQAVSRPAVPTTDLRLLQCEVTAGLFTFFFPRATMPPDEAALLQRLHTLWFHGEALFRAELPTHYDLVSKILTAWLHERQAIAALRHSMASSPGATHAGLVDRLLAMNDLRAMRLKWKNMSPVDGLSPEDLLCMAFRAMTNTEGSEYLFKDGLARLELGVFEFLRSEDSRIVLQRRDAKAV
ncbi:PAT1 domain containing protein [Pyrenophora teres f. teres]|nr:PAT1 domain containing protein [Pyrenophora teres f. teres]